MTERYTSSRFDPERHDASAFDSGIVELDSWLRDHAATSNQRGTARTWVWTDFDGAVIAYYSLAAHKMSRESLPSRIGRGGPPEVPAVLLAKLALARHLHGSGLGAVLVWDALSRVVAATRHVAARVVAVDAITEAVVPFYEHLGFRRVPGSLRLVQRVTDIEASLGVAPGSDPG